MIKTFRPFESESLPKYGSKTDREIEKAPKISPITKPEAPNSWAYPGNNGTTNPCPVVATILATARMARILIFIQNQLHPWLAPQVIQT